VAYNPISEPFPAGGAPAIAASFNADRTVLTLRTTDPHIVGHKLDYVSAVLTKDDGNVQVSDARAFLGPTAPRVVFPKASRHLTVGTNHQVTVPLAPLTEPAVRRVELRTTQGRRIGIRTLSSKNAGRTNVPVRVSSSALHKLSRTYKTAKLTVTNTLANGSESAKTVSVKLRRR
jgi:hypothetical protein